MPLSFQTKNQQFVFVDPTATPPNSVIDPEDALPNHLYDVFLVVQNTDSVEYPKVQVSVTHGAFGIGALGGISGLTQPAPVAVPPDAFAIAGTATVSFTFTTPAGGHGCLYAQMASSTAPGAPTVTAQQNVTVISCPSGAQSNLSFLVFGAAAAEAMVLTLTEYLSLPNGPVVIKPGSAQSWKPTLIAPPNTNPTNPVTGPTSVSVTLTLAANNLVYLVGLQVTIPSTDKTTHVFNIVGTVAGQYEGEVDITVSAVAGFVAPDPYMYGGYQSPDVLIFDGGTEIQWGGPPTGSGPTLLQPNQSYKLSAVVHNDSATAAANTVVSFWQLPSGVGATGGTLIDTVTANVPANGSVQVNSTLPFVSAPAGEHRCAVVSIYNAQSPNDMVFALTSNEIPNPDTTTNQPQTHSASAWRNTDSMFIFIGKPWTFAVRGDAMAPRTVTATATLVAAGFEQTPAAVSLRQQLQQAGARTDYPLYLAPTLRAKLPAADLKIQVGAAKTVTTVLADKTTIQANEFAISGVVPANANPGDIFLVLVSAQYADKAVEFLESLCVQAS